LQTTRAWRSLSMRFLGGGTHGQPSNNKVGPSQSRAFGTNNSHATGIQRASPRGMVAAGESAGDANSEPPREQRSQTGPREQYSTLLKMASKWTCGLAPVSWRGEMEPKVYRSPGTCRHEHEPPGRSHAAASPRWLLAPPTGLRK